MTRKLELSEGLLQSLIPLARVTHQDMHALLLVLSKSTKQTLAIEDAIVSATSQIPGISEKTIIEREQLAEAIAGLHYLKQSSRLSSSELIDEILYSFEIIENLDDPSERENLSDVLRSVLESEPITISTKSMALLQNHERLYLKSSTISEVRPVFQDNPEEPILAALVVHELKITFRQDGRVSDLFFLMDAADLEELIGVAERARKKANSISKTLNTVSSTSGSLISFGVKNG